MVERIGKEDETKETTYKKSRLPKELMARLRALPRQPKYFGNPNIMAFSSQLQKGKTIRVGKKGSRKEKENNRYEGRDQQLFSTWSPPLLHALTPVRYLNPHNMTGPGEGSNLGDIPHISLEFFWRCGWKEWRVQPGEGNREAWRVWRMNDTWKTLHENRWSRRGQVGATGD